MDLFDDEIKEFISRGDNPLEFPGLHFTQSVDESKALNESNEPCIIISASGMCDVGRIKHHLKHNIWNPLSTILFVGYQAPGTLGRRIVDREPKVKILGEEFAVKARIEYIEGFSGHADQAGLLSFVCSFRERMPKHIFLVHGEEESQETLKGKILEETNIPVSIPSYGEEYVLDSSEIKMTQKYTNPVRKEFDRIELIDKMQSLENELEEMKHALKENIRIGLSSDEDLMKLNNRVVDLRKQIVDIMNKGEN